ncbi:MAG: clostripain-related cysteine peptidase [Sulfurimonas sp.]|nr:clostripain-related cysteine peptidase [Sulfurimonas sp.]
MKQTLILSALLLSVSTFFYGCSSNSSTQQASTTEGKVDQTLQTSTDIKGYSIEQGDLNTTDYTLASAYVNSVGTDRKLFAIYMVGSDLETNAEAGTTDLKELIDGYNDSSIDANRSNLDIIVAFGGSDKDGWRGMRIATMAQLIADNSDGVFGNATYEHTATGAHMGDVSSLEFFLEYLKAGYGNDAQKVLTMWDHGSAYGSFGNDSMFDGDGLTMAETDSALGAVGLTFDVIGYDACLNANFELASVTKKYAHYHIGSEELEPGHGWNYKAVIPAYANNSDLEVYGKAIIDNYVDSSSHDYESDGKTLSMVDLTQYDELNASVNALAAYVSLNLGTSGVKESVIQSEVQAQQYGKSGRGDAAITIDLKGFSDGIAAELATQGQASLTTDLNTSFANYVIYAKNDGTRPNSNGVSIVPTQGYDDYNQAVAPSNGWYALTRSMLGIISEDTTKPTITEQNASTIGTHATFTDTNLASVTTVYGNIITEADGTKYFASVATLPTTKTSNSGEYFTPTWDQKWYVMYFGDNVSDSSWLSLAFENAYTVADVNYTTYSAEIEYIDVNKDYSKYPADQKYDYAKLSVIVNDNNDSVEHNVRPYKIVYQSAEDTTGNVLYDKASYKLKAGDKVQLLAEYFNMTTFDAHWFYEGDFLTMTKEPTFQLEQLVFTDDNDKPLDYYYMMIAMDIAGNWVNTEPAKVALLP